MSSFPRVLRASLVAALRLTLKSLRILFILALVVLPVPLASLVVAILRPARRNLAAQVLRKE